MELIVQISFNANSTSVYAVHSKGYVLQVLPRARVLQFRYILPKVCISLDISNIKIGYVCHISGSHVTIRIVEPLNHK